MAPEDRSYSELIAAAVSAQANAYAPYSGIRVGAAVLTADGRIVTGANVENSAYGDTICAERAALLRAYAMGLRDIEAVAVTASGAGLDPSAVVSPCGSCRQMLYEASEVAGRDIAVVMVSPDGGNVTVMPISELLPLPFSAKRH